MAVYGGREKCRPSIMGIINATPDSFHSDSRNGTIQMAKSMIENGADWIDIGGESTRPGSEPISIEEEIRRILPIIQEISKYTNVSVDTRNYDVAKIAIENGAKMLNDVSGLRDSRMVDLVLEKGCSVCIMHMLGEPGNMQNNPNYDDVCSEVFSFLKNKADELVDRGHPIEKIFLDPGIGFGKLLQHNVDLLKNSLELRPYQILWGVSRKSMIGQICGQEQTENRLAGTLAIASEAFSKGIDVIRVHDVREHHDLFAVLDKMVN